MKTKNESGQKRILIFGSGGQVGSALVACIPNNNIVALDYTTVDFTKRETILAAIEYYDPGLIINAAAYTAVDKAEKEETIALQVNGDAVGYLASIALQRKVGLIHFSTDYVFDGKKGGAYLETDPPNPISVYGRSKLRGEDLIEQVGGGYLIFRTSWVYSMMHDSFVTKVLRWARQNQHLRIVDDQISNPTWATMLAEVISEIVKNGNEGWFNQFKPLSGIYHLAGKGQISRFGWAKDILKMDPGRSEQVVTTLEAASSSDFKTLAERPTCSALNCTKFEKIFKIKIPKWQDSLARAMEYDTIK